MRIIEPSFSLHTQSGPLTEEKGIELLRWIEFNGRISHRSEDKQSEESWKRFIPAVVLDHGDWSIVEHATATAILRIDRGCTHELVRHRLFSYTQESTRFVNYKKVGEIDVIKPEGLDPDLDTPWIESVSKACLGYTQLMERKASPQLARSVLPNALASTISVTGNLRNFRHLFLMRTSKETHPDMKRTVIPMLLEFQKNVPYLFTDIVPNERQIDNLRKPR